jgi:hypothetical protein
MFAASHFIMDDGSSIAKKVVAYFDGNSLAVLSAAEKSNKTPPEKGSRGDV